MTRTCKFDTKSEGDTESNILLKSILSSAPAKTLSSMCDLCLLMKSKFIKSSGDMKFGIFPELKPRSPNFESSQQICCTKIFQIDLKRHSENFLTSMLTDRDISSSVSRITKLWQSIRFSAACIIWGRTWWYFTKKIIEIFILRSHWIFLSKFLRGKTASLFLMLKSTASSLNEIEKSCQNPYILKISKLGIIFIGIDTQQFIF